MPPGGGREDVVLAGLLLLPAAGAAGALLELALKRRLASQQLLALDLELDTIRAVGDESLQHSNKGCHNVLKHDHEKDLANPNEHIRLSEGIVPPLGERPVGGDGFSEGLEVAGEVVEDGDILLHPLGARPPVPRHRRVPLRRVERCEGEVDVSGHGAVLGLPELVVQPLDELAGQRHDDGLKCTAWGL